MSDFKANFALAKQHHAQMGTALAAGNVKQAQHHAGKIMHALRGGAVSPSEADMASNAEPDADDAPTQTRGFGPGKQFRMGSATGTPKPQVVDGQKPAARGILSKMKGFGGSSK